MVMHTHSARTLLTRAAGVAALLTFAVALAPSAPAARLARVTGRVTYEGRPIDGMVICFDSGHQHISIGSLDRDGTFELSNMGHGIGAPPGKYLVHIYGLTSHPTFPEKYNVPQTSGLEVAIGSGWNDLVFNLH